MTEHCCKNCTFYRKQFWYIDGGSEVDFCESQHTRLESDVDAENECLHFMPKITTVAKSEYLKPADKIYIKELKPEDDARKVEFALLAEYGKLTKELQDEKEKHKTRPSLRSLADEMVIEKQVWESTLHRSMKLQAENETLKKALKDCQEKILLMDYDSIKIEILQKINEVLDA